jgi:hypothetical protein
VSRASRAELSASGSLEQPELRTILAQRVEPAFGGGARLRGKRALAISDPDTGLAGLRILVE